MNIGTALKIKFYSYKIILLHLLLHLFLQESFIHDDNIIIKMEEQSSDDTVPQKIEFHSPEGSVAETNESKPKGPTLASLCQIEYSEMPPKVVNVPVSEKLLPVRMTVGSSCYTAAFRLDESNVCAEVSVVSFSLRFSVFYWSSEVMKNI